MSVCGVYVVVCIHSYVNRVEWQVVSVEIVSLQRPDLWERQVVLFTGGKISHLVDTPCHWKRLLTRRRFCF